MSFYVTLPSNGADLKTEEDLKKNTKTDFVINFDHPLELRYYDYEVALVEVWFPFNWKVKYGEILVKYRENNLDSRLMGIIIVEWYDGITPQNLVNHLNSLIHVENIVTENGILTNLMINAFIKTHFKLNDVGSLLISIDPKIEIKISGVLKNILINHTLNSDSDVMDFEEAKNFINNNIEITENYVFLKGSNNFLHQFDFLGQRFNIIAEIYVYTNIIDYQYVGQTSAQLLGVVSVNNEFNNTCHTIYVSPHYLPVLDNKIESIRIFMRDGLGNKIKFNSSHSNVIYKLHFRRRAF